MMVRPYRPLVRLSLDGVNACVHQGDRQLRLTPKAFAVLRHLMERPGQLATKDQLMTTVWPDTVVTEASLATCIREIRRALHDDAGRPRYIQTVHRRGYRFIGATTSTSTDARSASTAPGDRALSDGALSGSATSDRVPSDRVPFGRVVFGRERELTVLARALRHVDGGARRLIFVGGEPGIGKTTLVEHFAAEAARRAATCIAHGQCVEQYGACEAYLPWFDVLNHLARDHGREPLATLLRRYAPMWLAQLPWLIDAAERQQLQREIAGATRERMVRELAEALEALSADRPVVIILEDLHWSDPSSIGMLAHLARRQRPGRLLLIGTYRPAELHVTAHPLMGLKQELLLHGACEDLSLDFLTTNAVAEYIDARLPGAPGDLAIEVRGRTDGNPLFIVNVIDHLLARGALVQDGSRWSLSETFEAVQREVPESLKELIERQLDRQSADDRRVLEAASVAGATFSAASVAAALEEPIESAEERIGALARRGLFVRATTRHGWPDGTQSDGFAFIHVLYQHVLYERIGTTRRSRMHRQAGERLETGYRDRTDEIAAELALHFHRGRDATRAVRYLARAGENAIRRSAYVEAIALLNQGIDLLSALPEDADRDGCELQLRMPLGVAYVNTRGYAVPEVGTTFQRAYTLCRRVSETASLFRALRGASIFAAQRGDLRKASSMDQELLQVADRLGDPSLQLEAHRILGSTAFHLGSFSRSLDQLRHALALYDAERPSLQAFLLGQDPNVCVFAWQSWIEWYLGYPDRAVESVTRGIELARDIAHPYSLAYAMNFAAHLHLCRREPTAAEAYAGEALSCAREHGLPTMLGMAQVLHGSSRAGLGHREAGIREVEEGIARWRSAGCRLMTPYWLCLLASALDDAGRTTEALGVLQEAFAEAEHTDERWFECELYLLKASLTARAERGTRDREARARSQHVQRDLRRAFHVATEMGSPSLRLRAANAWGRVLRSRGKTHEARDLVGTAYAAFDEGFQTGDLTDARSMLARM